MWVGTYILDQTDTGGSVLFPVSLSQCLYLELLNLHWRFDPLHAVCEVFVEGRDVNVGPYVSDSTSNLLSRGHVRNGGKRGARVCSPSSG